MLNLECLIIVLEISTVTRVELKEVNKQKKQTNISSELCSTVKTTPQKENRHIAERERETEGGR